jgi:hypothetical protein
METIVIELAMKTHVENGGVDYLKCTQNCQILGEEATCRGSTASDANLSETPC